MKVKKLLVMLMLFSISATVVFTACKKDKDESSENTLEKSYFTIANSTFQGANFPDASSGNAPVINSIYGNSSVLEGGSNPISIETSSNIKEILVGVKGIKGYYSSPILSSKSTEATRLIILLFSQELASDSFEIVFALRNSDGLVSAPKIIKVTRIAAGTGKLQVSCSWDKLNDVDLHLVEPTGEEIYYGWDQSANGGWLDVDSNPDCYIDSINNENITYADTAIVAAGKYIVRVDLYSNCNIPNNTNFSVTARYNGQLIVPVTGTNPYLGTFSPSDEDYGGEGDGREVMTFSIAAAKSLGMDQRKLKFDYPGQQKLKASVKGQ